MEVSSFSLRKQTDPILHDKPHFCTKDTHSGLGMTEPRKVLRAFSVISEDALMGSLIKGGGGSLFSIAEPVAQEAFEGQH